MGAYLTNFNKDIKIATKKFVNINTVQLEKTIQVIMKIGFIGLRN